MYMMYVLITTVGWQGYVQGMSFEGDLDALNPQPNPGTMNFYLGTPKRQSRTKRPS